MTDVDGIFAAAKQLGEIISAQRAAHRQEVKDARNARRRQRYRLAPKPVRRANLATQVDDDYDVEVGCRCHVVPMAPCSWCESGGPDQAEDAQ